MAILSSGAIAKIDTILNDTYAGTVVSVFHFDYNGVGQTKTDKLDRLSVDHDSNIHMFFIDDTKVVMSHTDFHDNVEIL
jgi:hypothetical protein